MKNYHSQKEVLIVIPARSGSKGIKNKNLCLCAGESLLRRAVKMAIDLNLNSRIVVSTDSEDYLKHVDDLECSKDFLRTSYLSGDEIGDIEVLTHALHSSEIQYNESYKCISMLQPTSPLRIKKDVLDSINAIINDSWQASFTANKVDLKYHPLKSLIINEDGSSNFYLNEGINIVSRQMLKNTFIRNGACYSITPHCLTKMKSLIGSHSKIIETEPMVSIDTIEELINCEKILKERENK